MIATSAATRASVSVEAPTDLPDYAPMLTAYHRGHAAELRAMVGDLPVQAGDCVLDMPCGDGAYTVLLAEKVGSSGSVVGVDLSASYLELARARADQSAEAASSSTPTTASRAPPDRSIGRGRAYTLSGWRYCVVAIR